LSRFAGYPVDCGVAPTSTGQRANGKPANFIYKEQIVNEQLFEPKIIAFICNWCAYGAADLAGVSRLQYPPNVRAIRVMCSATVSPHHILRALQDGADGILVGG
jgi:F420-non-reducing hydrogenase iron-sulfur subunit